MFSDPGWLNDFLRTIFSGLDNVGYFFVEGIFNIFFTIVNADLFSGDIINTFYTRIQLILGILMIFRISITLLQMIVNPDMFKDKQKGAGSIVMRIAVMLILLSMIVPLENIPNDGNPLNDKIRSNGILFGFLYQFQDSVIQDNILGKLILGSNVDSISEDNGSSSNIANMADVGAVMSSTVAKAFIKPTLKNDAPDEINTKEEYQANIACPGEDGGEVGARPYFSDNLLKANTLVNHVNDTCQSDGEEVYVFDYTILGGLVSSIVMTIIIIGFTLDIAVRAIKLAILRLIAPVPIISYISPGQEKDGAFGNWVKTLTSTYLSLFIRLAIIYFGAYLIIVISEGGFNIWQSSTSFATSLLASIFIIIGILVFMRQAPKFFQDMLGIKGDGKLFSGIGTMLGAAALGGGLIGSVATNYRAARDEVLEDGGSARKARLMGALSGLAGGVGGLWAGGKALATSDKKAASAVFAAMQKRNAVRSSGVSVPRRVVTGASALALGRAPGTRSDILNEAYGELEKKAKANKTMLEEQTKKSSTILGKLRFGNGEDDYIKLNYTNFENRLNNARAAGESTLTVEGIGADGNRLTHTFDIDDLDPNVMTSFLEDSSAEYGKWQKELLRDPVANEAYIDKKLAGTAEELSYAAKTVQMDIDSYDYKATKGAIGTAMNEQRGINANRRSSRYRATAREMGASSGKK